VVISGTEYAAPAPPGIPRRRPLPLSPHDVRITREPGDQKTFPALIVRCNAAAPSPISNWNGSTAADSSPPVSKEEFQQLQPKAGEQVFVELKKVKVFSKTTPLINLPQMGICDGEKDRSCPASMARRCAATARRAPTRLLDDDRWRTRFPWRQRI